VDVSAQAHIYGGVEGYGLGVVASDLNSDGCPDLYVANDFQEDDFLYINNCDGTFTESGATALGTPAMPLWASMSPTTTTTGDPT